MSEPTEPPQRVRVTAPARRHAPAPRVAGTSEIDAQTDVGEIYMRSLLRDQLRLALRTVVALVLTVGVLPLLFHLAPGLADVRLAGVPLPWVLLGFAVYPWLVLLGWRYVVRAEATERDFAALVEEVER